VTLVEVDGDVLDRGDDGKLRCPWGASPPIYLAYHDTEWGRPVTDDRRLFEKICLEGFQAGLSWLTILRKRENFRQAFADFDPRLVANFAEADVDRLLADEGIIRHRRKIESTINNAARLLDLQSDGSLAELVWRYQPASDERPEHVTRDWLAAHPTSAQSTALSKELKRRGWTFVGPTTMYAFMQSVGVVNDHQSECAAASGS
jgi:DNA-3-methyladenine glycosylase I